MVTAATEIPAAGETVAGIPNDIWTAASTVATSALGFGVNRSALLIARAILAERQRAADIADATTIPFAAGRPRAEAHNAACRVISRAITGAST